MDYLASIRKKERENLRHILKETKKELCESVQDEKNEVNELILDGSHGNGCPHLSPDVARVSDVTIEPVAMNAKPIYWERMSTGDILGPAQPEFLAQVDSGSKASYWVVVQFEGLPIWINSILLRSKCQYELWKRAKMETEPLSMAGRLAPGPWDPGRRGF